MDVIYSCAHYRGPEAPERGLPMPSLDDQIRRLFSALTDEEKQNVLTVFEAALAEQAQPSSSHQKLAREVH